MKQQTKTSKTKNNIDGDILNDIKKALENIQWGSLEIFIQDSTVVQITERNIKKVKHGENGINNNHKHNKINENHTYIKRKLIS